MNARMWHRKIGDSAWQHLLKHSGIEPDVLASVLNTASEIGFRAPEQQPTINPQGTVVFWPKATLTWRGLVEFHRKSGHRFYLLDAALLVESCGQFLLPRLQEVLSAYEGLCESRGIEPVPFNDTLFVGGEKSLSIGLLNQFFEQARAGTTRKVVTVRRDS